MAEYEITIQRREPNPEYVPESSLGFQNYDRREANQREPYLTHRVMSATLTEAEYGAVKRALLTHWAVEYQPRIQIDPGFMKCD